MSQETFLPRAVPRSLACLGNAGDIRAWSNIPYFLFRAAQRGGFLTDALDLMDPRYRRHRTLWWLGAPLRLERPRGYQFSRIAIERMWACMPSELRTGEVISHFQLFPPLEKARAAGMRHSFYCDATLRQLIEDHPDSPRAGRRTWPDALRRERALYQSARFFIGMSRAAVASAVNDYGVDPANAHAVRPGANMDEAVVQSYLDQRGDDWRLTARFTNEQPATLGFIGMDWQRKGLPRLLKATEHLAEHGRPVKLLVIGPSPPQWQDHPLVEWAGVIRKGQELRRFIETVDRFALGCLPSYQEPLGISTLECLRLGVPVMGTEVGGIPDCVPDAGGFLVPVQADAKMLADAIDEHLFDEASYARMVQGAIREMNNVTWERTVEQLTAIWAGPSYNNAEGLAADKRG